MKLISKHYQPWNIQSSPPKSDKLLQWLAYGILAPSTFNAQPWACHLDSDNIEVYLDRSRLPTRSDKTGRFGYISVGCFIENIVIAADHFGWQAEVKYHASSADQKHQLVATLHFKPGAKKQDPALFKAIPNRATNRSPRLAQTIEAGIMRSINQMLPGEVKGVWLDQSCQGELINLSKVADQAIWSDINFRKEHVEWVRSNWTLKPDGMPGFGVGIGDLASLLARPIILSKKFATIQAAKNEQSLKQTVHYLILTSPDNPANWLDVGRSYEKVALLAASKGLALAPMGQFIEHDLTRQKLQKLTSSTQPPQLFCRVGYPSQSVRHGPRRSISEIII